MIMCLVEHRRGSLRDVSLELIAHARAMVPQRDEPVAAVLLGHRVEGIAETLAQHADLVFHVDDPAVANYDPDVYRHVLKDIMEGQRPSTLLIGQTSDGMDLAPALAAAVQWPIASDCVDVEEHAADAVRVVREMYGGTVAARLTLHGKHRIITMRPGLVDGAGAGQRDHGPSGRIVAIDRPKTAPGERRRLVEYVAAPNSDTDISRARVIVAIGRGVRERDDLEMINELADALGGVVACTRAIVDKGWLPHDRQVGSSGKTVKPELYLAIGISGAPQHVIGIRASNMIVAINQDDRAPILRVADHAIIGDIYDVVPALTAQVRARGAVSQPGIA